MRNVYKLILIALLVVAIPANANVVTKSGKQTIVKSGKTWVVAKTNTVFLTQGLVGYWTFDGKDTNWNTNKTNDLSGQGNTGTITNMSTSTAPAAGKIGQAFKFDGVDDYVDTGISSETLFSNTTFSISIWAKNTNPSKSMLFGKGGYSYGVIALLGGSAQIRGLSGSDIRNEDGAINTLDGNWHHLVYVFTTNTVTAASNNVHIYIDGVLHDGSLSTSYTYKPATGVSFTIGARREASHELYFSGSLDEVRIYNRALSLPEISALYRMGY